MNNDFSAANFAKHKLDCKNFIGAKVFTSKNNVNTQC